MAKQGTDLGTLQSLAEQAAKNYRAALTAKERALAAADRAEESYLNAQKALAAGLVQVRAATKVS